MIEFTNDEKDILQDAIDTFGGKQEIVAMEECSELIQAITKNIRKNSVENRRHIIEEVADVIIMCEQLLMMFDSENGIEQWKYAKVKRLKDKILNYKMEDWKKKFFGEVLK